MLGSRPELLRNGGIDFTFNKVGQFWKENQHFSLNFQRMNEKKFVNKKTLNFKKVFLGKKEHPPDASKILFIQPCYS